MPKKILVILPFIVMLASPVLANSVAQSQRMLNQLGYNAGPVDGAYGGKTRGALEKFYADNGSLYDGKLDANEVADLTAAMSRAGIDITIQSALSDKTSLSRAGWFRSLAVCQNTPHSGTLKRALRSSV